MINSWFPFSKKLNDVPTKLFIKNNFSLITSENLSFLVIFATILSGFSLIITGWVYSRDLQILGILILIFLPRMITAILNVKLDLEKQQFDLDALFALNEILTITSTTGSEAQSVFLLSKSYNVYLQYVAKKSVLAKSTHNPIGSLSFIDALKDLWNRPSQQLFIQFFENWDQNTGLKDNQSLSQQLLLNHIQTQLKKDETYLDNWTSYLNAFFGIVPIGLLFVVFLSSSAPRFVLELALILLFGLIFVNNFLDPYKIQMMSIYTGNLEDTKFIQGALIADTLVKSLQRNPDFFTGLREVLKVLPNTRSIRRLDYRLACGEVIPITEILNVLKPVTGGKERIFLQMTMEWCKIDVSAATKQLIELIKNLSLIESENNKKRGILLGEKRKSALLLGLSAFSLGLLLVISPLFMQISNFSKFQQDFSGLASSLNFSLPLSLIVEIWLIILLLACNYFSIFRLRNPKNIFTLTIILSILFYVGLLFAWGLVHPTILLQ